VLTKFGIDVIASCAFGIEYNSFKNPDEQFRRMTKRLLSPSAYQSMLQMIEFVVPNLIRTLKIKVFDRELESFFVKIVEDTVTYREKNGVTRKDFMQLLIQLKNDGKIDEDGDKGTKSFWQSIKNQLSKSILIKINYL
jgi:cytochrome P450 family 6